jgi:sec-independent protein translocase protein TatA
MPNIGPLELIIVLVIVLVLFGAKRLPEVGRGLGSGMREFKDSVTGKGESKEEAAKELSPSTDQPAPTQQHAPEAERETAGHGN